MEHDFTYLTNHRAIKYGELRDLYRDPLKNAQEIRSLNQELSQLDSRILSLTDEQQRQRGFEYSTSEGVYRKQDSLSRINPLFSKRRNRALSLEDQQQLNDWDRSALIDSLSGNKWYNEKQVAYLTGNSSIPVGDNGLQNFLHDKSGYLSRNGSSLSFAYLAMPDKKDESRNHFVSMHIENNNGSLELQYFDSNGELMRQEDRQIIKKQFPNINIAYRDYNGQKMTESQARSKPEHILRVQFDDHNCGMYSTEITNVMKHANGNEALIQDRLLDISTLEPSKVRQEHYKRLKIVYNQNHVENGTTINFDPITSNHALPPKPANLNEANHDRERKQMSLLLREAMEELSKHPQLVEDYTMPKQTQKLKVKNTTEELSR